MTWETELSANGNTKETWEKLIDSGKVGYMALLRNLHISAHRFAARFIPHLM